MIMANLYLSTYGEKLAFLVSESKSCMKLRFSVKCVYMFIYIA